MKTYKFEVGQEYLLRDGNIGRVYFVVPSGDRAAGLRLTKGGGLIGTVMWDTQGRAEGRSEADIVGDAPSWKDEIPWDAIREEYKYVAMDCSGRWYAFSELPRPVNDVVWCSASGRCKVGLSAVCMPDWPTVPWDQTLVERPSK